MGPTGCCQPYSQVHSGLAKILGAGRKEADGQF